MPVSLESMRRMLMFWHNTSVGLKKPVRSVRTADAHLPDVPELPQRWKMSKGLIVLFSPFCTTLIHNFQVCRHFSDSKKKKCTRHVHPAHAPRGTMALGRSTPVRKRFVPVLVYQVTPWPACGSDLANRGGPPKCHFSTRFEGRMHVSGAWQGPQQCCYSGYDCLHEWQFLKAPHDLISESYAVIIKQS